MPETKSPRHEGRTAFILLINTGVVGSWDDCEYEEGTTEREEWMAGWKEMQIEYKKLPRWEQP